MNEWICLKDEYPEKRDQYLVVNYAFPDSVFIATWCRYGFKVEACNGKMTPYSIDITHWMKIPRAPYSAISRLLPEHISRSLIEYMSEQCDRSISKEELYKVYMQDDLLSDKERRTIEMRFGFFSEPQDLGKVGKHFSVTRERVHQIEQKALRKIKKILGKYMKEEDGISDS